LKLQLEEKLGQYKDLYIVGHSGLVAGELEDDDEYDRNLRRSQLRLKELEDEVRIAPSMK
jgi:hypothetical protein